MDASVKLLGLAWAEGVPVPRDADGRMVPLSVKTLFAGDGKMVTVDEVVFDGCQWYVKCSDTSRLRLDGLHLSKPDSWERLEQDAAKAPCDYFGVDCPNGCDGCPAESDVIDTHICYEAMAGDLIRRAKALAGVSE